MWMEPDSDTTETRPLSCNTVVRSFWPNIIRAAIVNGGGATDFCARFLDPDDRPLRRQQAESSERLTFAAYHAHTERGK